MAPSKHILGAVFLLVVLIATSTARAKHATASQVARFVVDGNKGSIEISVHPDVVTAIHFSSPVVKSVNAPWSDVAVEMQPTRVLVRPRSKRSYDVLGNVQVMTRLYDLSVLLRQVERPEQALAMVDVSQRSALAARPDTREAHTEAAAPGADRGGPARDLDERERRRALDIVLRRRRHEERVTMVKERLYGGGDLLPVVDEVASSAGRAHAALGLSSWVRGEELWTSFELGNDGERPLRLEQARAVDASGKSVPVEVISIDSPAAAEGGLLATIPPGARARGVLLVPDAIAGKTLRAVTFQVQGLARPIVAAAEDWVLVPRRRSHIDADKAAMGRVSLHLHASGGILWLRDGLELDRLDPTSMKGLGMTMRFGVNRWLTFEAAAMGASTGEARFDKVTWAGMQGDLVRSAGLGRVHISALLGNGQRFYRFLRVGMGAQGTSNDAFFISADGARTPGPDIAFELDGIFFFGGGLDLRLGDHVLAGIDAAFVRGFAGERSLEAGIHIGYRWKP